MLPDTTLVISLGESSIQIVRRATMLANSLVTATIAGNVADADNDGFGDNANALPGSAPVFMSAGVNQSGGSGSGGTVRMQFEWDISNIGSISNLQGAQVLLPTHRGTIDSLDTFFYAINASGDGNLTNSDFESPATQISGAVMPVPPDMTIGADGTFTFNILSELRAAATGGFNFFAIQGRVNETLTSPSRGLEVRTTASGNISSNAVPTLALTTSTATTLSYRITSLPAHGVLRDNTNQVITTVPFDLVSAEVSYTPSAGFVGQDQFSFSASNGIVFTSALARISVFIPNCAKDAGGCFNGR